MSEAIIWVVWVDFWTEAAQLMESLDRKEAFILFFACSAWLKCNEKEISWLYLPSPSPFANSIPRYDCSY